LKGETMTFNPREHLTNISGKQYLGAAPRMQWFRDENPHGRITTDLLSSEPAIVRAEVYDEDGVMLASGMAMAIDKGGTKWAGRSVEKAETAAIARALKHAGYGTEFALDDTDDDSDHLADSPVASNGNTSETWATEKNLKVFFDVWNKTAKLSDGDVCKLAGIETSDQWGTKYTTSHEASAAIKEALQREADAAIEY